MSLSLELGRRPSELSRAEIDRCEWLVAFTVLWGRYVDLVIVLVVTMEQQELFALLWLPADVLAWGRWCIGVPFVLQVTFAVASLDFEFGLPSDDKIVLSSGLINAWLTTKRERDELVWVAFCVIIYSILTLHSNWRAGPCESLTRLVASWPRICIG